MAELKKVAVDRLFLSDQVITAWETTGGPGGTPVDRLRLVAAEITILEKLGAEDEPRAAALIERYKALAARLRAAIN